MIPVTGQRVGPYEILGRLGSGGMGLVFSAWDNRLHRDVAIKLLREEYMHGDSRERFMMEARAASGLNHPNICTIFDIGEQSGNPYLVMELLKGETLRTRLGRGPMSPADVLDLAIEVAEALSAAHARGVIHRDIKPANIFLVAKPNGGWQSKVLDFGLAKIDLGDGLDPMYQMTGQGSTVGTVAYMSPEQARGENLDARSDLFALGIVLYEMSAGHVPFEGVTSALIFVKLLGEPPERIRELKPAFPKNLERIILKLLAKDRGARFQSATELCEALRNVALKKSGLHGWWLSKPLLSVVRKATDPPPPSPPWVAPNQQASAAPQSVADFTAERRPSAESVVIHPVRRKSLPPTELSSIPRHWTQPRPSVTPFVVPSAPDSDPDARPSRAASGRRATFGSVVTNADHPIPPPIIFELTDPLPPPTYRSRTLIIAASLLVAAVLAGLAYAYLRNRNVRPSHTGPEAPLLISVANQSGDKSLDGVILEALRLSLTQSPHLAITEQSAPGLVSLADARRTAKAVGATSFLFGQISKTAGPYTLSIGTYDAATGGLIIQAEDTAASRDQLLTAIDRISSKIRMSLGESRDTVARTSIPLAREATSNIDAIEAFATGSTAEAADHPLDAMTAFRRAVLIDPKFTQAWLRLASIYANERAEVAAADAATHARDASVDTSDRNKLLAAASYDLYATADYPQATEHLNQLAAAYPLDNSFGAERSLLLQLQGKFPEALEVAQRALARNPHDREAARQAEYAMLALDQGDAVSRMESQSVQQGQRHPELRILIGFDNDPSAPVLDAEPDHLRAQTYRAQLLDASGKFAAGLAAWRATVSMAQSSPVLVSAGSYAPAQAALDRALTNDCASATVLATEASTLPRGQSAIFAVGMAQGLCGDLNGVRTAELTLQAQYPLSFAVKNYYLANLTAIDHIRSGDTDLAIATLDAAKAYDSLSLTAYLRAMAQISAHKFPLAITDFQSILRHRGATLTSNAPVYALSQLGLARAYAASADRADAAATYAAFLQMWKDADAAQPFVIEARRYTP